MDAALFREIERQIAQATTYLVRQQRGRIGEDIGKEAHQEGWAAALKAARGYCANAVGANGYFYRAALRAVAPWLARQRALVSLPRARARDGTVKTLRIVSIDPKNYHGKKNLFPERLLTTASPEKNLLRGGSRQRQFAAGVQRQRVNISVSCRVVSREVGEMFFGLFDGRRRGTHEIAGEMGISADTVARLVQSYRRAVGPAFEWVEIEMARAEREEEEIA